jgi:hypothetical protein
MTVRKSLAGAAAVVGVSVSLASPAAAGARAGEKTFQQTFPVASRVCEKVAAGTENAHLKKFATQVAADCATLQAEFSGAQTTVLAVRASVTAGIAADRSSIVAACPTPNDGALSCKLSRAHNTALIKALHHQMTAAARSYWHTVELARHRFWTAIRTLPGNHHIKADLPIPAQSS